MISNNLEHEPKIGKTFTMVQALHGTLFVTHVTHVSPASWGESTFHTHMVSFLQERFYDNYVLKGSRYYSKITNLPLFCGD